MTAVVLHSDRTIVINDISGSRADTRSRIVEGYFETKSGNDAQRHIRISSSKSRRHRDTAALEVRRRTRARRRRYVADGRQRYSPDGGDHVVQDLVSGSCSAAAAVVSRPNRKLSMLSRSQEYHLRADTQFSLDCEFFMEGFNVFENPTIWLKSQWEERRRSTQWASSTTPSSRLAGLTCR